MNMAKKLKSLPMAIAAAAVISAVAPAGIPLVGPEFAEAQQQPKKKKSTRKVPALSLDFHKKITKGQEAMDEKNFAEAKTIINDALGRRGVNNYEKAVAYQYLANIAFEEEQPREAIRYYEQILEVREQIPEQLEISLLYNLAQLWYVQEDFDKSLKYVNEWEPRAEVISVNQLIFISQIYYTKSDYSKTIEYVERGIREAETAGLEIKENWYQLILSSYWELGNFSKVRDTLELLLITWPKPSYWTQLAGVYGELGQDQTSFSVTEAAYKQGFLNDKPQQLVNHAQILLSRNAPIKAAWVLRDAFKDELVEQSAANQKTLGQAYLLAAEYKDAVGPLSAAAKEDADGSLWFQIGQVLSQLDRHAEAADAFQNAINIDGKEKSAEAKKRTLSATMLKGTSFTELKKFKEAKAEFAKARKLAKNAKDRRTVKQWEDYLKVEEEREKILADAS
jgi:tetratricopeptide (TPR) repeat protein